MSTDNKQITAYTPPAADIGDPLWDPGMYQHLRDIATVFAASQLVPQHLRGKPEDCFLAIAMAKRSGQEPLSVLQSIHFVKGKAGWSATYLIARAKLAGMPIRWVVQTGEDLKVGQRPIRNLRVTAWSMIDGERVESTLTTADAIAEGWTQNSKYFSLTEQMLRYRTATFLVRLYMPEIMLGLPPVEEIETLEVVDSTPAPAVSAARIALDAANEPAVRQLPAPVEAPKAKPEAQKPVVSKKETVPTTPEVAPISSTEMP